MIFNLTYYFKGIRPSDPARTERREYATLQAAIKGAMYSPPEDIDPDEPDIRISGEDGIILAWANPWTESHEYTRAGWAVLYG